MTQNAWSNITTNLVVHYDKYIFILKLIDVYMYMNIYKTCDWGGYIEENKSTENIVMAFLKDYQ